MHIKLMINVMEAKILNNNYAIGMKKLIYVKFGHNVLNNNKLLIVSLVELASGMENVNKFNAHY